MSLRIVKIKKAVKSDSYSGYTVESIHGNVGELVFQGKWYFYATESGILMEESDLIKITMKLMKLNAKVAKNV